MGIRITCCLRYHLLELSNDFVHNIQPFYFSVDDSNQLPGGGFKYFLVCSPPFGEDSHFDYPPEVFTVRPWKYTGPQKEAGSSSFQPSIFSGAFAVKFRGCHILNMVQHDLTKLGWLEIPNCNLASICGHSTTGLFNDFVQLSWFRWVGEKPPKKHYMVVSHIFYFYPETWGRWTHFDEHIFQTGWWKTTN